METKHSKSFIDEVKKELEELEKKLKKSGTDAVDAYKQSKEKLTGEIKKYAAELEDIGEEKIHDLKESSEELLDLLEANYDLSYTDYENESHKLSTAIDKFEKKAKAIFQNLTSEARQAKATVEKDLDKNLNKFKTELDIQKAHIKGTKERAVSEFEEWKEKRLKDIDALKVRLEQKKEETEGKIEGFSDEISDSFDHLKKAFKKLW